MSTVHVTRRSDSGSIWLLPTTALAWLTAVVWASLSGALGGLANAFMPAYAALVAVGIATPVLAYFSVPAVRHATDRFGLRWLTLMHVWRIPAALLFFWYGALGELPTLFWVLAGVGDLLAGCFAATLWWRPATRERLRRIHIFGFADFVVAVGTGLAFTLLGDPRMALLTTLPMALIPLFGVGLSGASHIVALHALTRTEVRA
ncbi:MAG: permease [Chitinophagaceae bacterium]|nr:permease [Rubrivivax sp.]